VPIPKVTEVPAPVPAEVPPIEAEAPEAPPGASGRQEIWAYVAHWMGDSWRVHDLRAFHRLIFFDIEAGTDGRIKDRHGWPERWEEFRSRARAARVPLDPAITVIGTPAFSALFGNPEARTRLVTEIARLSRHSSGVHLDVEVFETMPSAREVQGFRQFVADLRKALDATPRKILTAFVPVAGDLYGPKEIAMLDTIVAQGYDVHWREAPNSGPVALLDGSLAGAWVQTSQKLAALGAAPRKILFSTPLYGYEWPTVSAEPRAKTRAPGAIITYAPTPSALLPDLRVSALARAAEHGLRREPGSGAPWYAFRDRDGWRQGWFDDPVSLAPRLRFVTNGDYRGVALFVLGYDGGALLDTVQAHFKAGSGRAADARRPEGRKGQ
jgi:hypothetical protein